MEFDSIKEAGEYLKTYYELDSLFDYFLESDRTRHGHACPICGHGTRSHKEGLSKIPNTSPAVYHCFCCEFSGDAFDLLQKAENINYTESVKKFAEWLNFDFTIKKKQGESMTITPITQKAKEESSIKQTVDDKTEEQKKKDNIEKIIKAKKAFDENPKRVMEYMANRGFTFETCQKEGIGYDKEKDQVIIPTCKDNYIYRSIETDNRGNGEGKQSFWHFSILENIISDIFSYKEIFGNKLFICEAWADGMALSQIGFQAIALNSTGKKKEFIDFIKKYKYCFKGFTFLLNLDNDEAGKKATEYLEKELKEMGLTSFNVTPYLFEKYINSVKDTNELLIKDSEYLEIRANGISDFILYEYGNSSINCVNDFENDFEKPRQKAISTGFESLNKILYGGFFTGLYILGAVSSLGKTSFALQIASSIAESGQDVLLFSLEMSKRELLAKIISRFTFENNRDSARNTIEILNNFLSKNDNSEAIRQRKNREEAFNRLKNFANKIYIFEGIGNITTEQIRKTIKEHIKITGNTPFILIDYVQIIAPIDFKMTDKQATDRNITELKRISRDFNCVILGISSFNRESYKEEVSLTSFKESGAIEYGSDVLLGLQYKALEKEEKFSPTKGKELETDAQYNKRKQLFYKELEEKRSKGEFLPLQVKILKNRNGRIGKTDIYFKPPYNYFTDNVDFTKNDFESPFDL